MSSLHALVSTQASVSNRPPGLESIVGARFARFERSVTLRLAAVRCELGRCVEAATELLEADAPKMKEKLTEQDKKLMALVETAIDGTEEDAEKARTEFISLVPVSTRLLKYLETNISLRQKLGLDVEADVAYLRLAVEKDNR